MTKLNDEASLAGISLHAWSNSLMERIAGQNAPGTAPNKEFENNSAMIRRTTARTKLSGESWIAIIAVAFGIGAGVWFMVNGPVFQQQKRDTATENPGPHPATSATPSNPTINPLSVMVDALRQSNGRPKAFIADALDQQHHQRPLASAMRALC